MSIRQLLIADGPTSPPFSLHKIALEEHFIDPSLAHPFYGFRTAVLISGGLCAAGGLLAAVTITNPRRVSRPAGEPASIECLHCGLYAPPLTISVSRLTRCQRAAGREEP